MNYKKVLITGGAGFIGSYLVRAFLDAHWKVTVLDNCFAGNKLCPIVLAKIDFIQGDTRDFNTVLRAAKGCFAIIHLAAIVGVDEVVQQELDTVEIEALGTQNVGKAAQIQGVKKIIYASSSAVYKNTLREKSTEQDELNLVNTYAVAKRLNERYFASLAKEKGISTNSLRFFNIYGYGQDERMVMPRFFEKALQNKPLIVFGNGQQTRDFTYVSDVATSILGLVRKNKSGIFNISRGTETTILQLAQLVKKVTHSPSKIQLLDFPEARKAFRVDRRVGCSNKLFRQIGFQPSMTLEEGLEHYMADIKNATSFVTI